MVEDLFDGKNITASAKSQELIEIFDNCINENILD